MGVREKQKIKKLSHKYDSHTVNLLKLKFPSKELSKGNKKRKRAEKRFWGFVKNLHKNKIKK